jgi:hypothetical protein
MPPQGFDAVTENRYVSSVFRYDRCFQLVMAALFAAGSLAFGDSVAVKDSKPVDPSAPQRPSLTPVTAAKTASGLELFERSLRKDSGAAPSVDGLTSPPPPDSSDRGMDPRARRKALEQLQNRRNWMLNGTAFGGKGVGLDAKSVDIDGPKIGAPRTALERRLRQDLSQSDNSDATDEKGGRSKSKDGEDEKASNTRGNSRDSKDGDSREREDGSLSRSESRPDPFEPTGRRDSDRGLNAEIKDSFRENAGRGLSDSSDNIFFRQDRVNSGLEPKGSPFENAARERSANFGRLLDGSYRNDNFLGANQANPSSPNRFESLLSGTTTSSDAFAKPISSPLGQQVGGTGKPGLGTASPETGAFQRGSFALPAPPSAPPAPSFRPSPGILPLPSRFGP